ncbi:MAG TPA: VOC family protein [Vicinamibacterales bacterium]|nr:VOC family protein [Vicinamibacterales bacterium]
MAVSARFDHLVVGIRSLAEGVGQFKRLIGLEAAGGGTHPGRGTENALVSLGSAEYLEIIAPRAEARLSDADAKLRELDRLTIVTWAVAVDNADDAREILKAEGFATTVPQQGSRVTPSGERLDWEVFRLTDAKIGGAPFFIEWSDLASHPSSTAPSGCVRERFHIQTPASDRLSAMLNALGLADVTVANGAQAIEASITSGSRRAIFTSQ